MTNVNSDMNTQANTTLTADGVGVANTANSTNNDNPKPKRKYNTTKPRKVRDKGIKGSIKRDTPNGDRSLVAENGYYLSFLRAKEKYMSKAVRKSLVFNDNNPEHAFCLDFIECVREVRPKLSFMELVRKGLIALQDLPEYADIVEHLPKVQERNAKIRAEKQAKLAKLEKIEKDSADMIGYL